MAATGLFADLPYNAFAPFTAPPPTTPSPEAPSTTTPKISPPTTLSTTGPATTAPKMGPQMGPPHPPPMGPPHPRHMKGPFGPSNPPPMGPSNPPHMKGPLGPSNPPPMGPPHPPPMGPPHPRHMKGPLGPSHPPPTKGPATTKPKMGPPNPPPTKGPPTTAYNVHASTPYWSWSAIQKIPPARPGSHAPTTHSPVYWSTHSPVYWSTPLIHWDRHDTVASDIDWLPKYNYKFVFVDATPPPMRRAIHTGSLVVKIIGGAVGFFLTLVILSNLKNRKQRSRRGIVLVTDVAVEQNLQPEWRPPVEPGVPGPLNNDMPPSYQECALYSVSKEGGEAPPPYTVPEHHKQLQGGFIDSERRACAGEVAPGMRTELVFDSGRVVERLSLDATSDNKKKKEDSNDDVENQRTTEVDLKDKVVYSSVNETRK